MTQLLTSEDYKPFKILCIDGGGIKGLYSATVLEHLEQRFGLCGEYFDMICGTSTGGLIALGLALGKPSKEISRLYMEEGSKIFPRSIVPFVARIRQALWGGKYSDKRLRKILETFFQEKKVGDLNNLICIPSYSVTDARPWVFKRDHGLLDRDNGTTLVDVALATSAAPTFFPLCEIPGYDHKQFIDGGVWANNPTLIGIIEALTYFVGKDKSFNALEVLSISSLNNTGGKSVGLSRHRSFMRWGADLFDISLNGQSAFTDYFLQKLCGMNDIKVKYVRIPSEMVSSEQQHLVKLDCAKTNAIRFIRGKGNDRGTIAKKDPAITDFFKTRKLYNI
ncbi:CBASS cGAMP-activated phospholipase [Chitinophaga sp. Ak27]|uniref:CBASS cGAMP-activated phospholipase n=1 Tax=Chitinophaga sp. Ak27 TaxID=2726116 RepID=UPI00145CB5B0|nr:CBASS cGAMP-activated phospholipase [Chitinophaga sp. Ak27]NLU92647.1 patatin-like phospholipase family protein [Chitinophaga sp. Ak27]